MVSLHELPQSYSLNNCSGWKLVVLRTQQRSTYCVCPAILNLRYHPRVAMHVSRPISTFFTILNHFDQTLQMLEGDGHTTMVRLALRHWICF